MALDTRLDTALNMASLSMTSLQRCTTIVLSRCKSTYGADPRSCCTTFHASQSPSLRPAATSTLFASMDISTGGRGAPNESWKESRSSCGWTRSMPLGKMLHRYLTPEGMPPPPLPLPNCTSARAPWMVPTMARTRQGRAIGQLQIENGTRRPLEG